jgi:hypothetical protein
MQKHTAPRRTVIGGSDSFAFRTSSRFWRSIFSICATRARQKGKHLAMLLKWSSWPQGKSRRSVDAPQPLHLGASWQIEFPPYLVSESHTSLSRKAGRVFPMIHIILIWLLGNQLYDFRLNTADFAPLINSGEPLTLNSFVTHDVGPSLSICLCNAGRTSVCAMRRGLCDGECSVDACT